MPSRTLSEWINDALAGTFAAICCFVLVVIMWLCFSP